MPVITLTSDWNMDDFYAGSLKGMILSKCPAVNVIDISHKLQAFNTAQAAFIIKNSYKNFPKGTVHIIAVNSNTSEKPRFLVFSVGGQFFITYDSGIYGLIFKEEPDEIIELSQDRETISTFPELDIFIPAACRLVKTAKIAALGKKTDKFRKAIPLRPTIEDNAISGSVIYIDSYKNAVTNISSDLFQRIGNDRNFEILIGSNHNKINNINQGYYETTPGELLAVFNSVGLLEIAINQGNASELLGLEKNSGIRVVFKK